MTCPVCGGENRLENRFCKSCGIALNENRKVEAQGSTAAKCAACGQTNEPGSKFCGMCGAKIGPQAPVSRQPSAVADANAAHAEPSKVGSISSSNQGAPPQRSSSNQGTSPQRAQMPTSAGASGAVASRDRNQPQPAPTKPVPERNSYPTTISGPSFLGLSSDSQNADYLLEDESSSSGGGLKMVLLVLFLAAVAGLIFVQWRSSHKATPKPPELASSSSVAPPSQAETSTPPQKPQEQGKDAHEDAQGNNAQGSDAQKDNHADVPAKNPEAEQPAGQAEPKKTGNNKASETATVGESTRETRQKDDKDTASGASARKASSQNDKTSEAQAEVPKSPSMELVKAQRYLQGRGVRQNCAQGLQHLKAAAEQNDPGAVVQMAALYASGHCVPQDRIQAYRWFTSAVNLQPSNRWIQTDLNQLWAEMTPAERRQISK